MNTFKKILILLLITFFCTACLQKTGTFSGKIDYLGDSSIILKKTPLHYKYSPVISDTVSVAANGDFSQAFPFQNADITWMVIDDEEYPLITNKPYALQINIQRAEFPQNLTVSGYPENWSRAFDNYLVETEGLDERIDEEIEKMKVGEKNDVLELSKEKAELAKKHLEDTPLDFFYLKTLGEYLVYKVRAIEYNGRNFEDFDTGQAREEVLREARKSGFFTLKSLKAQRAGIRDFTHYYSRTFGIYDSVKSHYNQNLAEYDIKRLAYEELNEKRMQVLNYIDNRDALAHARMYLVAERIGEQPLEVASPGYEQYLEEFPDYPEYTSFLKSFYDKVKSVSPGEPAIPFSLPDRQGNFHTMDEYSGKYVLLDFWAGWCQPCLDEFPHMRRLYNKYPREQFEIVGISTEEDSLVWIQDIERFENPWPQLYGGNGFDQKTFSAYQGGGIPFYILINPEGNIERYNDIRASFNLESVLDSLLYNQEMD